MIRIVINGYTLKVLVANENTIPILDFFSPRVGGKTKTPLCHFGSCC